jgi:hypothetical protein
MMQRPDFLYLRVAQARHPGASTTLEIVLCALHALIDSSADAYVMRRG